MPKSSHFAYTFIYLFIYLLSESCGWKEVHFKLFLFIIGIAVQRALVASNFFLITSCIYLLSILTWGKVEKHVVEWLLLHTELFLLQQYEKHICCSVKLHCWARGDFSSDLYVKLSQSVHLQRSLTHAEHWLDCDLNVNATKNSRHYCMMVR